MGAWIEIPITSSAAWTTIVAPLVGAWIEMHRYNHDFLNVMVAPLVGAWIEIDVNNGYGCTHPGRSPRGSVD